MAKERMVRVNLRRSVGLRGGPLYGPGEGILVPESLAQAVGAEEVDEFELLGGFYIENATKDELQARARELNIEVTRSDGKDGDPLVEDYRQALREYSPEEDDDELEEEDDFEDE